ncbi:hypothetical protein BDW71DRAFT_48939 [Aspergillus fruticulosus]
MISQQNAFDLIGFSVCSPYSRFYGVFHLELELWGCRCTTATYRATITESGLAFEYGNVEDEPPTSRQQQTTHGHARGRWRVHFCVFLYVVYCIWMKPAYTVQLTEETSAQSPSCSLIGLRILTCHGVPGTAPLASGATSSHDWAGDAKGSVPGFAR